MLWISDQAYPRYRGQEIGNPAHVMALDFPTRDETAKIRALAHVPANTIQHRGIRVSENRHRIERVGDLLERHLDRHHLFVPERHGPMVRRAESETDHVDHVVPCSGRAERERAVVAARDGKGRAVACAAERYPGTWDGCGRGGVDNPAADDLPADGHREDQQQPETENDQLHRGRRGMRVTLEYGMLRETSIRRGRASLATLVGAAVFLVACSGQPADLAPGSPQQGLDQAQLERFASGKALFDRVFSPAEGLGPVFNENQCSACHTDPASGGTGGQRVLKATRFDAATGTCDRMEQVGGTNIRTQMTPALRSSGVSREGVPQAATARGRFTPPFLFGAGLVEAVPDAEILHREDVDDRNGDGISGRAGRTADGRVARFGRKAETATLIEFVSGALRLEMGLTTVLDPHETGINGRPLPRGTDPAPDPEIDSTTLYLLTDYVRILAPLAPGKPAGAARDSAERGRQLFQRFGCSTCHAPMASLYSDLLLHDMGPALGDVCGITAAPSEVRTEPLAGLRYRETFLHDGRALSVRDAILTHDGEAARARARFAGSSVAEQLYLLRFLDTL